MKPTDKVFYYEIKSRYPFFFTNSITVANIIGDKLDERYTGEEGVMDVNILDADEHLTNPIHDIDDAFTEYFNKNVRPLLEMVGCTVIEYEGYDSEISKSQKNLESITQEAGHVRVD